MALFDTRRQRNVQTNPNDDIEFSTQPGTIGKPVDPNISTAGSQQTTPQTPVFLDTPSTQMDEQPTQQVLGPLASDITTPTVTTPTVPTPKDKLVDVSIDTPKPDVDTGVTTPSLSQIFQGNVNRIMDRIAAQGDSARLAQAQRVAADPYMTQGAKAATLAQMERQIGLTQAEAAGQLGQQALNVAQLQLQEDTLKGYDIVDPVTGELKHIKGTAEINDLVATTENDIKMLSLQDQGTTVTSNAITGYIELMKGEVGDVNNDGTVDVNDWLADDVFVDKVKDWWEFSGDGDEWVGSDAQIHSLNMMLKSATTPTVKKNIENTKGLIGYDQMDENEKGVWDQIFEDQIELIATGGDLQNILDKDGNVIGQKVVNVATGGTVGEEMYFEGFGPEDAAGFESVEDGEVTEGTYSYDEITGEVSITGADGETQVLDYDPALPDTAFTKVSNDIISAGRDANPVLYDMVVDSRATFAVDEMIDNNIFEFDEDWNIEVGDDVYNTILEDPRVKNNVRGDRKLAERGYSPSEEFQYFDGLTEKFSGGPTADGVYFTEKIEPGTPIMLLTEDGDRRMFIYKETIHLDDVHGNDELDYRFIDPFTGDEYQLYAGNEGRKDGFKGAHNTIKHARKM